MATSFKILLDDSDLRGLRADMVRNCRNVMRGIDHCDFWVWATLQALHMVATDQVDVPFHLELCDEVIVDIEDCVTAALDKLDTYDDLSSENAWISAVANVTKSMYKLTCTGGFKDYVSNIEFLTETMEFTKFNLTSADYCDLLLKVDLE